MKNKIVIILVIVAALVILYFLNKKGYLNMVKPKTLLRYFKLSEFDSTAIPSEMGVKDTYVNSQGKTKLRYSGEQNMDKEALFMIDDARHIIEKGWNKLNSGQRIVFSINSGYRTPQYNSSLPNSATNSPHMLGKAFDINTAGMTEDQKKAILAALYEVGFRRFGIYSTFIHVDSAKADTGHYDTVWIKTSSPVVENLEQIALLAS